METKQLVIPVVVFALIAAVRWALRNNIGAKIPKIVWPILAPALGLGLDYGMAYIGFLQTTDPAMGAILGSAGVGLRELINQFLKQTGAIAPVEPTPPAK